jgi:hypothetical protein
VAGELGHGGGKTWRGRWVMVRANECMSMRINANTHTHARDRCCTTAARTTNYIYIHTSTHTRTRTHARAGQVLHSSGGPALWRTTYDAGRALNRDNAAGQAFDPSTRSVLNRAEYFGGGLAVEASGTYEELVGTLCSRISSPGSAILGLSWGTLVLAGVGPLVGGAPLVSAGCRSTRAVGTRLLRELRMNAHPPTPLA